MDGGFSRDLTGPMALMDHTDAFSPAVDQLQAHGAMFQPVPLKAMARVYPSVVCETTAEDNDPASLCDPHAIEPKEQVPDIELGINLPEVIGQTVLTTPLSTAAIDAAKLELRAEIMAEMSAALDAERAVIAQTAHSLAEALQQVTCPPAAVIEALEAQIEQAVTRLAIQRAGYAIDAHPAGFADRIKNLANRISDSMQALVIHLHPDDCKAVSALFDHDCPAHLKDLMQAKLMADPNLSRGDARLRASGLLLDDVIADVVPTKVASAAYD